VISYGKGHSVAVRWSSINSYTGPVPVPLLNCYRLFSGLCGFCTRWREGRGGHQEPGCS